MTEHWNVQIKIQRVTKERQERGALMAAATEREITEVLSLAVVEATETQAYEKARRLLAAHVGAVME